MKNSPPPLKAMAARMKVLEQERAEIYPLLKAALEDHNGNVTRASAELWPDLAPRAARDRGNRYARRFELVAYAASLREAATGHAFGRQYK